MMSDKKVGLDEIEQKVNKIMGGNLVSNDGNELPTDRGPDKLKVDYESLARTYLPKDIAGKLSKLNITEKREFVNSVIEFSNHSRYRIGRICKGEECTSYKDCPLAKIGTDTVPVGERCPFELLEVDKLYTQYYNMFVHEFRIDQVLVEVYLRELIVLEINIQRINEHIADRGLLEESPIFGFPKSERVVNGKIASPLFEMLDRLMKRKDAIFKAMAITPEARLKYKTRSDSDLTKLLAELKKRGVAAIKRMQDKGYEGDADTIEAVVNTEEGEEHGTG